MLTYRRYTLSRLSYLVRKIITSRFLEEYPGMRVEIAANEVAEGFAIYLQATVLGQQRSTEVEINAPDGRWQALRLALGLSYRKRKIRFTASTLFPHMPTTADAVTYLEWEDTTNAVHLR